MSQSLAESRAGGSSDDRFRALLDRTCELTEQVFAPRANEADRAAGPPAENIRCLAEAGLLGLTTPARNGGHEAPGSVVREYREILAAACGLTTFVELQHLGACGMIARGTNDGLKEAILPELARGSRLAGLAFSHLRRPGPPTMRTEPRGDTLVFNGTAPWLTGWGLMDDAVLGGTLPDGRLVYVLAPLAEGPALQASPPMQLCAMNASATVSITCRDFVVGPERFIRTLTLADMAVDDRPGVLNYASMSFGVAWGAIRLLRELAEARNSADLAGAATALDSELANARDQVGVCAERTAEPDYLEHALPLRAWAIELGVRAAHTAVTASGGSANSRDHTAQRLFREAMVYTLTAQTRELQITTLHRLAERGALATASA